MKIKHFMNMTRFLLVLLMSMWLVAPANAASIQGKAPNFTLKSNSVKNVKLS